MKTNKQLEIQRVRHPVVIRMLQVKRVTDLNPSMRRITLTGGDLSGFHSASFDDHVKLLLPEAPGKKPCPPSVGPEGLVFEDGQPRPAMRDYTPRRYDPDANELDIDFVLHDAGPATDWARHAEPGHQLAIGGPRGSVVVPTGFDWHLLIGDETALPAIGRRLEELPADSHAIVLAGINHDAAKLPLSAQCSLDLHWVPNDANGDAAESSLEAAARKLVLPSGDGFVWAAGEYSVIRAIRKLMAEHHGIDKSRIRAASYWRKDAANSHEQFE